MSYPTKVRYLRRFVLADYEHEELEMEIGFALDSTSTMEEARLALENARDIISKTSMAYQKAKAQKNKV